MGKLRLVVVGTTLFSYAMLFKLFLHCVSDMGSGVGHMKVSRIQTHSVSSADRAVYELSWLRRGRQDGEVMPA